MRNVLLFVVLFSFSNTYACLEAFQFKIFPIGFQNGVVYTLDVQIKRTSEDLANRDYNTGIENPSSLSPVFVLNCFLSEYDKKQKLISTQPYHTAVIVDSVFADSLSKIYEKTNQSLYNKYPKMKKIKHCSYNFCEFNQECKNVGLTSQTEGRRDSIWYKNKKYSLKVLEDENYFKLIGETRYQMGILGIGTINTYKTRGLKIIIAHLVSADEITYKTLFPEAMSENTNKEIAFTKTQSPIFEEPLLDHAYGVDFFILKKHPKRVDLKKIN
jgi:hypothetical protein